MELSSEDEGRVAYERQRIAELEQVEPLATLVLRFEREQIVRVIELCQGNHEEAAIRLGIGRSTMYRKLGRK